MTVSPPVVAPFILFGNEPQPHHPRDDDRLDQLPTHARSGCWCRWLMGCWNTVKDEVDMCCGQASWPYWHQVCSAAGMIVVLITDLLYLTLQPQSYVPEGARWHHRDTQCQPNAQQLWSLELATAPPLHLQSQADETLRWCCDRWWRGLVMRLQAQARLAVLLADWLAAAQVPDAGGDIFDQVEHEARHRLPTGFNVSDMARACGMSRVMFSRQYTVARAESPGKFLRRLRLQLATELLLQPDWSIGRIAKHVGYSSAVTFGRLALTVFATEMAAEA